MDKYAIYYLAREVDKRTEKCGWGYHCVVGSTKDKPKGIALPGWVLTDKGYEVRSPQQGTQLEPIHYQDTFARVVTDNPNLGTLAAIQAMVDNVTVLVDTLNVNHVVLPSLDNYGSGLMRLNEIASKDFKNSSGVIANVDEWRYIHESITKLEARGVTFTYARSKGGNDPGVIRAEALASTALNYRYGDKSDDTRTSPDGYWSRKARAHRMFGSHWYIFTRDHKDNLTRDDYHQYLLWVDADKQPAMRAFGSPLTHASYAVVRTKQPDPLVEELKNFQLERGLRDAIYLMRPQNIYGNRTLQLLEPLGMEAVWGEIGKPLACATDNALTQAHWPIRMGRLGLEILNNLTLRLDEYLAFIANVEEGKDIKATDPRIAYNVTDQLVETTELKSGRLSYKLINPGGDEARYVVADVGTEKPYRLIYGIDLPPRNSMSGLVGEDLEVWLVLDANPLTPNVKQLYTIVKTSDDIGIWTNPYALRVGTPVK